MGAPSVPLGTDSGRKLPGSSETTEESWVKYPIGAREQRPWENSTHDKSPPRKNTTGTEMDLAEEKSWVKYPMGQWPWENSTQDESSPRKGAMDKRLDPDETGPLAAAPPGETTLLREEGESLHYLENGKPRANHRRQDNPEVPETRNCSSCIKFRIQKASKDSELQGRSTQKLNSA